MQCFSVVTSEASSPPFHHVAVNRGAEEVRGRERLRGRRETRHRVRGANRQAERRRLETLRRKSDRVFARNAAVVRAAGGQGQLLRRGFVDDMRLEDALLFRAFVLGHDRLEVHEYTGPG